MSSPDAIRMKTGKVTGTTSLIKVPLPFTPRKVELTNVDGLVLLSWSNSMDQDSGLKTVQGTPVVISVITSNGITAVTQLELDDGSDPTRGFTIGTDSDVNASTEVIHWVAYE